MVRRPLATRQLLRSAPLRPGRPLAALVHVAPRVGVGLGGMGRSVAPIRWWRCGEFVRRAGCGRAREGRCSDSQHIRGYELQAPHAFDAWWGGVDGSLRRLGCRLRHVEGVG